MRLIDLTGQTFGRLTVLARFEKNDTTNKPQWIARCACGSKPAVYNGCHLRDGHTRSCGCLAVEALVQRSSSHGKTHSVEYSIWSSMHTRCSNPKAISYRYYGALGIRVCERWSSFEFFYADMGPRPEGMTLDRIDSTKNYALENCRWASRKEQSRNRRTARILLIAGEGLNLVEAAERFALHPNTLHSRLARGWSVDRALTHPLRGQR